MKAWIVGLRLIKEIGSDKRTIAMVFLAPILIISLLYLVLNSEIEHITIGLPDNMELISESDTLTTVSGPVNELIEKLENGEIDGYVQATDKGYQVIVNGTDPTLDSKVIVTFQQEMSVQLKNQLKNLPMELNMPEVEISQVYGELEGETFDHIAPFMMGYVVFFLIFLLSGIAFLRERISGTMTRMMSTSVRRGHIVIGYMIGFGFFALLQTLIIQIYMIEVLKIPNHGNFFLVLLTNIIIAAGSLTLGILLSAFARNEFQLFQFIPIVIIPQTLFAGLFSLRDAHPIIIALSKIFPLKYAADALTAIMLKGQGIQAIWGDLLVLLGFMLLFLVLNIRVLRKYRNS